VFTPVYPRQNVGRQGADIVRDQVVLHAGDVLNPSRIGALAALGAVDVEVFARPTVAILSTGNEIVDPGRNLMAGQIYDINKFTLSTIIAEHGGTPISFQTAEDTIEDLERAIDACLACDALVFSGGSSVGERDLILDVLGRRGHILFHGIAVKPGKPTVFGAIDGKPVFGMPVIATSCSRTRTCCWCLHCGRMARLPLSMTYSAAADRPTIGCRPRAAISVYTVRVADAVKQDVATTPQDVQDQVAFAHRAPAREHQRVAGEARVDRPLEILDRVFCRLKRDGRAPVLRDDRAQRELVDVVDLSGH